MIFNLFLGLSILLSIILLALIINWRFLNKLPVKGYDNDSDDAPTIAPASYTGSPGKHDRPIRVVDKFIRLRLDVAVPENVYVGQWFRLAFSVRQPYSEIMSIVDLKHVESGKVVVDQIPKSGPLRLIVKVYVQATDCEFRDNHNEELIYLYYKEDTEPNYFLLRPLNIGTIKLTLKVYEYYNEQSKPGPNLGNVYLEIPSSRQPQQVGGVEINVFSQPLSRDALKQLRPLLEQHFNLSELRTLCFDLDIPHENFGIDIGKNVFTGELIEYCRRKGRLSELVSYCQRERPHVDWELKKSPS